MGCEVLRSTDRSSGFRMWRRCTQDWINRATDSHGLKADLCYTTRDSSPESSPKRNLTADLLTRQGRSYMDVPQFIAGRFRIEREIGRGGMGAVYLATHLGLDRPVAVKI